MMHDRTDSQRVLDGAAIGALVLGLVFALVAPEDRLQGDVQRLMYVHVPAAWLAYLSFFVTLVGSIAWLRTRRERWDHVAASSAELGVLFTSLTLVLGSLWGKPVWGVWWTWDPRLVSTALLLLIYMGYLALRRSIDDPGQRALRSAVLGVVAFAVVPVVHMSVEWWRTLHQPATVLQPGDPPMDHTMLAALLVNVAAFTLVYAALLRRRVALSRGEADAQRALDDQAAVAGDAVAAPRQIEVLDG